MRSASKKMVLIWQFTLCLSLPLFCPLVQAQDYSQHQLQIFNALTEGVKSLGREDWRFTAIAPLKPDIIPLFWGDRKAYTGDINWPQDSYPPIAIASEYQKGRFVALGHDGLLIDPGAEDVFTGNILNWLGYGYQNKKVIIYTHLGRWFNQTIMSAKARQFFAAHETDIIELADPITDKDLQVCDLLIIVRPSEIIEPNETTSIVAYVARGGSLLMSGMGWFWQSQNKDHDIKDFPLNRLGEHLGFEYSKTSIDKSPPDNKKGVSRYSHISFQPLSARKPVEVKNYSIKGHDNRFITDSIARDKDKYYYVVEGKHVRVSMPYRFWMKCRKPVDFVTRLDAVYELYADLTDGITPFDGDKILILNVDNLVFHMCSGNPILSRQDRIEYIISELEKSNYKNPSWGLMHELGHDFIAFGMKHYFVFGDGDNECWAEFFCLYACQKLGLTPDKKPAWLAAARAYHQSGQRDFERIKNQEPLMIGFLHHIRNQYGWDVYKELFKRYAELIREKKYLDFNDTEKKVDLFVKELSLAAGENLYPYFDRWGFPLNQAIQKDLEHLPRANLTKLEILSRQPAQP